MLEKRPGRVDAEVARLVHDQQRVVLVGDPVIQVGLRFGDVGGEVFDAVVEFEPAFRVGKFAVQHDLARRDPVAPLIDGPVGEAPRQIFRQRETGPRPVHRAADHPPFQIFILLFHRHSPRVSAESQHHAP